jgi:hypothetical protein
MVKHWAGLVWSLPLAFIVSPAAAYGVPRCPASDLVQALTLCAMVNSVRANADDVNRTDMPRDIASVFFVVITFTNDVRRETASGFFTAVWIEPRRQYLLSAPVHVHIDRKHGSAGDRGLESSRAQIRSRHVCKRRGLARALTTEFEESYLVDVAEKTRNHGPRN